MRHKMVLVRALIFLLLGCASDITGEKGEKGEQGPPGDSSLAVVAINRPAYRATIAEPNKVSVPASAGSSAEVSINGAMYKATSNVTCDVTATDRGGLEAGSSLKAATLYYLYAVPAVDGSTFELTASEKAPSVGPASFGDWTYLGGFRTKVATTDVHPFVAASGMIQSTAGAFETLTETTGALVAKTVLVPPHASSAIVGLDAAAPGPGVAVISVDGATDLIATSIPGDGVSILVPMLVPQKVWLRVAGGAGTATLRIFGWVEAPAEFQ